MSRTVALIQQDSWHLDAAGTKTMPLVCGDLKAVLDADDFGGSATPMVVIRLLLSDCRTPDLLDISVFGTNSSAFGALAITYRQFRPDGLALTGTSTNVTDHADRVFRLFDAINVVVNKGEWTFRRMVGHQSGCGRFEQQHAVEWWSAATLPQIIACQRQYLTALMKFDLVAGAHVPLRRSRDWAGRDHRGSLHLLRAYRCRDPVRLRSQSTRTTGRGAARSPWRATVDHVFCRRSFATYLMYHKFMAKGDRRDRARMRRGARWSCTHMT